MAESRGNHCDDLPYRPKPVLTKRDFVQRYFRGEFGNRSPTWLDPLGFRASAPDGELYHFRNGAVAGGQTFYKQTKLQALTRWAHVDRPEDWYCSMQVPERVEKSLRLQGEVAVGLWGMDLHYTTVPLPMRDALAKEAHDVNGVTAVALLAAALCPNSYDWLRELLTLYPDHVVEFSTYGVEWGTLPNFNTVVWECRAY